MVQWFKKLDEYMNETKVNFIFVPNALSMCVWCVCVWGGGGGGESFILIICLYTCI